MEPLANLKVIEMGQLIAGPFAAKTLADFGADVIKIEPPHVGDALRKWRLLKDGTSVWWQVQSRNKRSLSLDLKQPEAQDIVRTLITEADILIENFGNTNHAGCVQPSLTSAAFYMLGKFSPCTGPPSSSSASPTNCSLKNIRPK